MPRRAGLNFQQLSKAQHYRVLRALRQANINALNGEEEGHNARAVAAHQDANRIDEADPPQAIIRQDPDDPDDDERLGEESDVNSSEDEVNADVPNPDRDADHVSDAAVVGSDESEDEIQEEEEFGDGDRNVRDDGDEVEDEDGEDVGDEDEGDEDDGGAGDRDRFLQDEIANKPLYTGASLSVGDSVGIILRFVINNNLSGSTISEFLTVVQLLCPADGYYKLSLYKLRKYFHFSPGRVRKIYYCSVCSHELESPRDVCELCAGRRSVSYFLQVPLVPQLKQLFARPNFMQLLEHRFARRRENEGWIEDIYDGAVYTEQVRKGFLSNPRNFSMIYFTDGVPVFKSKKYSFWPFYLTINELPYKERIKRENTLLAGLWFGSKPNANLLMMSFCEDLRMIYNGVKVFAAGINAEIQVRGLVLGGVADTPARSAFMNFVGHNGFYGCPLCETRGETVLLPNGNDTHSYTYGLGTRRTVERVTAQAAQAMDIDDDHFMGVKGPTALRLFVPDFMKGTGIDCMHLLMGVSKKLMNLHFDSSHGRKGFSLRAVLATVDELILTMKPPKFVHRLPRSVADWCHWKASEYKAWFFYYSVVIYQEVMRPVFFDHYLKLVVAVSYLQASSISLNMINKADELLHEFVRDFQNLYGLHFCSINIHMLLHLPDCVRNLGPTWVYTCFPYENINGEILRVIHGKTNVDSQVTRMHWQWLTYPLKVLHVRAGPIKDFCENNQRGQLKIKERIRQSCYAVGTYSTRESASNLIRQGLRNSNVAFRRFLTYCRLLKNRQVYVSEKYTRDLRSSSSYIVYKRGNQELFGTIYIFVKVLQCACVIRCNCEGEHFAIVRGIDKEANLEIPGQDAQLLYMHKCSMTLSVSAIPVSDLETVCWFLAVNDKLYIGKPVNDKEGE